ncbi:nicotinate-nucleotide--dimethylbenzimidazole phosphoribosyltransferase [Iodobacter fluviatilis]|uniref:Nicotinate-nucleotide--dimethylbenzimidazole phosphoribosyltransferase n=1 Tax=Iodobacter fluviatilis TaxID=537 RepID=A0A7G3GA29_9NEIS|nr:nicotinate-nucleotide--dimethylbenzimidazole phosphoribosyltransferase [Iodobacter fluviatilis]QBC43615.1 nicotinate-nucleotide--dimethylbenzimidazole phosphoribosyltransferase [Iodobacter fluviatilis]
MSTPNQALALAALNHQSNLTKPQGSLGKLEELAVWFAARSNSAIPGRLQPAIVVFAADHGVVAEGVSAFPKEVTGQMVANFVGGGAAINVLAREVGASLSVVDVGVASSYSTVVTSGAQLFRVPVRAGTGNLRVEPAMSEPECHKAWSIGVGSAQEGFIRGKTLLIGGEMGIANTTAAAALICALTGIEPEEIVGLGTGISATSREHKVQVVKDALVRARAAGAVSAKDWLMHVGGLEIAALAGFYTGAAEAGIPILLDGFITTAAALVAVKNQPRVADWLLASHVSDEKGHRHALAALQLEPLLALGLRLGEGSGAALTIPLIQSALALHREMATFSSAGIATKE